MRYRNREDDRDAQAMARAAEKLALEMGWCDCCGADARGGEKHGASCDLRDQQVKQLAPSRCFEGQGAELVSKLERLSGEEIRSVQLEGNALLIRFTASTGWTVDEPILRLEDMAQCCCEKRWMSTDDDLAYFAGAKFLDFEVRAAPGLHRAPEQGDFGDEHEIEFLVVRTSKGEFTMTNHNEHNGYYGGFSASAKVTL